MSEGPLPLRVGLDARLDPGVAGGVQQFLTGLAAGLASLDRTTERYCFLLRPGARPDWLLPSLAPSDVTIESSGGSAAGDGSALRRALGRAIAGVQPLLSRFVPVPWVPYSDGAIERAGVDVMHLALQGGFRTRLPTIYQPFDLQHLHHPEFFPWRERRSREVLYRGLCAEARVVTVMTRWVKHDLEDRYGLRPDKVRVVNVAPIVDHYPAPSPDDLAAMTRMLDLPAAFAFYPAQTWPHKNHLSLLEALALLRDRSGLRVPLICTGSRNDFFSVLERRMETLRISDQVRFLGYVPNEHIRCLYEHARMLVFPSRFEGGGMPVLEAFSLGLPVASSKATCLADIVDDAGLTFDPDDVEAMAAAIERLWSDDALRRDLACRGRQRVAGLTWPSTAASYRALYRLVGERSLSAEDRSLLDTDPRF